MGRDEDEDMAEAAYIDNDDHEKEEKKKEEKVKAGCAFIVQHLTTSFRLQSIGG
jgi:hypothetical protein